MTQVQARFPRWAIALLAAATSCSYTPLAVSGTANLTDVAPPAESSHPTLLSRATTQSRVLWRGNFGQGWEQRWGVQTRGGFGPQNRQIVSERGGTHPLFLRVRYPQGSISPGAVSRYNVPLGGSQFFARLPIGPQEAVRLSYAVRFSSNFSFVRGGKLPGLYGGRGNTGGSIPNGTDGFSTRFMWRQNGAGEVYAYLPTSRGYGTSIGRGNWRFSTGVWHRIDQEVTLNTPGQANGRIRVWFNGRQVLDQQGVTFRTVPELQIDGILFSTFFGGEDPSWATPRSVHADFADFVVYSVP
ncbi:hypothetical protein P7L53_13810 [Thermoleptolyngbya sichuanensis XZ-Cy5]|uniref:polysaccharide lyase n=1 Tax=Thermoleptolyngbya sichuanensis TaxID=2885951 RepID=UPI00240E191B|nr:hypothetical protein [Thermoleptolyngbya sichuanensis]MDG2617315.1 hypothetical protein [Thermoleptolyngbya sichuanensis XZ-Cy5]